MAKIFITGSSDGLGLMAGELLLEQNHDVIFHARSVQRAEVLRKRLPGETSIVVGDFSRLTEVVDVANQVNALGRCDVVIHNAGVGYREPRRSPTAEGLPLVIAVNSLAPYVLTAMLSRPKRLVYVSSGLHHSAAPDLSDLSWTRRRWDGLAAYSESKFHDVLLAMAVARRWPDTASNALEPGWVPTKMGGSGASDDLAQGHLTQVWLATSDDSAAKRTGGYFYHLRGKAPHPSALDVALQEQFLNLCADISGIAFP